MKNDPELPQFEKCRELWEERFRTIIRSMVRVARVYHLMPVCAARLEQCEDGIIDLLITGSGRDV